MLTFNAFKYEFEKWFPPIHSELEDVDLKKNVQQKIPFCKLLKTFGQPEISSFFLIFCKQLETFGQAQYPVFQRELLYHLPPKMAMVGQLFLL